MKENVASMTLWSTTTEALIHSSIGKAPYTIITRFWRNLEGKNQPSDVSLNILLKKGYNTFYMLSQSLKKKKSSCSVLKKY